MIPLVSVEQFLSRIPKTTIMPTDESDEPDAARIEIALRDATGIITANLPWLLSKETGEIALPVNPQFADALNSICTDIALYRLTDSVSGSEDAREKYRDNMSLLNKINREYQGGLEGPGLQSSAVVTPNDADGIEDGRYFKKGWMY
jgi:phage gp36-like protein